MGKLVCSTRKFEQNSFLLEPGPVPNDGFVTDNLYHINSISNYSDPVLYYVSFNQNHANTSISVMMEERSFFSQQVTLETRQRQIFSGTHTKYTRESKFEKVAN